MIAQEQIHSIPCAVALDKERKMIAVNRNSSFPLFIDIREAVTAMWDKGLVKIGDKEYNYNTWYSVADNESAIHQYFKSLIIADRQNQMMFSF